MATANAITETEYYGPIALDVDGRGVLWMHNLLA